MHDVLLFLRPVRTRLWDTRSSLAKRQITLRNGIQKVGTRPFPRLRRAACIPPSNASSFVSPHELSKQSPTHTHIQSSTPWLCKAPFKEAQIEVDQFFVSWKRASAAWITHPTLRRVCGCSSLNPSSFSLSVEPLGLARDAGGGWGKDYPCVW